MSQIVSSVAQAAMQQGPEKQMQQNQTQTKTSFEETLQKTEKQSQDSTVSVQKTQESFNNPQINQLQNELQGKYQQIPQVGPTSKSDLLPNYDMLGGRMSLLKETVQGLTKAPDASGIRDYMGRAENMYGDVVKMMNSNKDLRPGELLALQARMYMISQHIDVMSKVVDQMTGGVKTVLNTNI
jgi:pyruvate carboxylase